jgi:uncharacterized protein YndB with AHSA1/START domain
MSEQSLHQTLVFTRVLPASPAAVFAAYADAGQRSLWGAPSETAVLVYDAARFSVGGTDRFRCGSRDDPRFAGTTFYLDIVPDSRIVSSEVIALEGKSLSAALTTLELSAHDQGTALKLTVQATSFMGPDMFKGHEQGYNDALDNLVRFLEGKQEAAAPDAEKSKRSTNNNYLAVFLSNKTGPRWRAWQAMSEDERRAKDEEGLAALKAWDETHRHSIVYEGGPLGPTKRVSRDGVAEAVNELTVFMVVRAPSHDAAARLFEGHPHCTIFPCHAVEVMPPLGPGPGA